MPTFEAVAAGIGLLVVWRLTRLDRWVGGMVSGAVALGCVYAALGWGVWFGGPVILLGAAVGLTWGWAAGDRRRVVGAPPRQ